MRRSFRLKVTVSGLSLLLAFAIGGCSGTNAGRTNINMGMDAIEAHDYAGALSCFSNALSAGEDTRLAYRGMGIAYMGQGAYDSAIASFETALKSSNGLVKKVDYDINYYLAMAQYKSGDLDKAMETYNAILALDEKAAQAHYLRGRIELLKNDKAAALSDFDRAVELEPGDNDLYIYIFRALDEAGSAADGEVYINKALGRKTKLSDYQSGMYSYYLGKYDEARNFLESARDEEETAELILYLGKSYEALGDTNYAATLYTGYLEKDQNNAAIYNELGLVYLKQEEYRKALTVFENGLALNDPAYSQSLMFNEAVAYEYLLDFKKAGVLMKEYLDMYPDDEEAQREYIFLSTR